jgi:GT2 family glycosyltransferase
MERAGTEPKLNAMPRVGSVIIGRNEGERLVACLRTQPASPVVYVDSGSTDDSVANARVAGATVVQLSTPPKFSAARARNAGMRALLEAHPDVEFIQMTDGDCELRQGWIESAVAALQADPSLALVFGRRRERHPERSVYNALCDDEWNLPVGEAAGCGGDALFRAEALRSVGGYNEAMIAGEDSELSMRLRKKGWRLRRIDAEMTWHDANILRFSQFWTRARRSGHGYAEMAHLHPDARWPDWPRSCRSIMIWGGAMPLALAVAVALAIVHDPRWWAIAALVLLPWPLKIAQLFVRQRGRGLSHKVALASAALLMIGKLPQFLGLASFHYGRWLNRASPIIEYKGPRPA